MQYDLSGRHAFLTGGRTRIGYATGLKLLRAGATLYTTSRFPFATVQRYSGEKDADQWLSRLHVFGIE